MHVAMILLELQEEFLILRGKTIDKRMYSVCMCAYDDRSGLNPPHLSCRSLQRILKLICMHRSVIFVLAILIVQCIDEWGTSSMT